MLCATQPAFVDVHDSLAKLRTSGGKQKRRNGQLKRRQLAVGVNKLRSLERAKSANEVALENCWIGVEALKETSALAVVGGG